MTRTITLVLYATFCMMTVMFLQSCDQNPARNIMDNYYYRLNNALKTEQMLEPQEIIAVQFPSRRDLRQSTQPIEMGMLDFLRMSSCELQRHVGLRNSSLGKVMADSLLWQYEIKFIQLAYQCLKQLNDEPALAQKLEEAIHTKIRELPKVGWNATFASEEFQSLFSTATQSLSQDELSHSSTLPLGAIEQLSGQIDLGLQQSQQIPLKPASPSHITSNNNLEEALQTISHSHYLGQLQHSLNWVTFYLNQSTQLLQYAEPRKICLSGRATPQMQIVINVFNKYYLGEVQPYFSRLYQQALRVRGALEQLKALLPSKEPYNQYWRTTWSSESDSTWHRFEQAMAQHTESWQQLYAFCKVDVQDIRPTKD